MRVAAIDCGTNSIRLLIADVEPGATTATEVARRMEVVRLGQGVDKTGELNPEALERTFKMAAEYARECEEYGVERIRFAATSATRDASNRVDFVNGIKHRLGVEPEVLTGAEEAQLSFAGATSAVQNHPSPYLIVDLGGGSTEFVFGTREPEEALSVDVGCVRMTERHLAAIEDGAAHLSERERARAICAARADVDEALDEVAREIDFGRVGTLIGLAGTVTTLTAHALGLPKYDRDAIHGAELPPDKVIAAAQDLLGMPRDKRAALPYMHPGRVDVMGGGALVWERIVRRVRAEREEAGEQLESVVTSEHDILDGLALSMAANTAVADDETPSANG